MFNGEIGTLTEGQIDIKTINVATIQTLMSFLKRKDSFIINFLANVGTFIIDESHVAASKSYVMLSKYLINADIRLGLSGTYKREDGDEMQIEACVGYNEYKVHAQELIDKGHIMKPSIYFYEYKKDSDSGPSGNYNSYYDFNITFSSIRNSLIIRIVEMFKNKNILIIVNKIAHGESLQKSLSNSVFIHGSVNHEKREEWLAKMKSGKNMIIIGTASIVSKGVDIPNLDVMINATGNLSAITSIQSLGRVLRKSEGKDKAIYIDFIDKGEYLKEHSEHRLKILKEQGHDIKIMKAKC
jgi:superfamily II DNA or RNA helicase